MRYVYIIGLLLFIVLISGCISEKEAPQTIQPASTQPSNVTQTSTVTPTLTQIPTVATTGNQTPSAPPSIP